MTRLAVMNVRWAPVLWLVIGGHSAHAATLRVPSDHPTIQAAIDAASALDTVLVDAGTYTGPGNKNLGFGGKALVLRSENGADQTILDCQGDGRGLYFHQGESLDARVEGFSIVNGNGASFGGGILIDNCSPTITDCRIYASRAQTGGGVACQYFSSPSLVRCRITGNSSHDGGGVACYYARAPRFTDCLIVGNAADGIGGGIVSLYGSGPVFIGCTVSGNRAPAGGGIHVYQSSMRFERTILWGNCADQGAEAMFIGGFSRVFVCSAVDSSGVEGPSPATYDGPQVFTDPVFCSPAACHTAPNDGGDYRVQPNSPCLAAASPCGELIGARGQGCATTSVGPVGPRSAADLSIRIAPNPFQARTVLSISLSRAGPVQAAIYDLRGSRVAVLQDGGFGAGSHEFEWDGRDATGERVGPGLYFARVSSESVVVSAKVVVAR